MTKYLLDTNVVLRFANPSDQQHDLVTEAIAILLEQSNECYLTAQVLIELWVVATRPVDVNGLGWSTQQASNVIEQILTRFPLVEETAQIFPIWLNLVTQNKIKGKRTHDARIIAVMLVYNIRHILTLNPSDFKSLSEIITVNPQEIINFNQ
jgi:predicted nucleic acid-binding protein